MRKLLLLRGLPGCGKSTFVRERGLEAYTISPDTLRMAYGSPVLEADGNLRVPAEFDRAVWAQALDLLEKRMFRGELVVLDATHSHPRSFSSYQQLARKHRYQVLCIDFASVPFEVCMERNLARPAYNVVPPKEMARMRDNLERTRLPGWLKAVPYTDFDDAIRTEPKDVSQYRAINHIGDLQGCYDPLMQYFATYGLNDDELYVFVGDYLDRGTQNGEVMQWLLDNYHRPNLVFVEGNHEAHLRSWCSESTGGTARSREFNLRTRPQLEAAGLSPKKVHGFLYQTREMFYYTFHGRRVLVTHGGLSAMPDNLAFVNSLQLIKGAGMYEQADEADASFARLAPPDTYQVHGHRNRYSSPTQVGGTDGRCFNLEGKVEFGGELRTVTLTADGFEVRAIKSGIDASDTIVDSIDGFGGDLPGAAQDVSGMMAQLRASDTVYEKPQPGTNISSFNFKRDVFFDKKWDDLNVHARGLFINVAQQVIVARSYEKFFNVGERPETRQDALAGTLRFPVSIWVKENGYLGLVGYDPESDGLVFASKSSLTSEFAGWLREQFDALLAASADPDKLRREIKLYCKSEGGRTLVFEVIEPQRDPHIVTYGNPELVLLDIVRNAVDFQAADERERARIAAMLGCRAKRRIARLKDHEAFEHWCQSVNDFDYTLQGCNIEGFVIEDSAGFKVKLKLPWYAFWRQMRTQLERLQAGKQAGVPALEINGELAREFLDFMARKTADELRATDICRLRDEFYAG